MKYYECGSLLHYKPESIEQIISIINQTLSSSILAFEKLGFIHGDLHPGNILIKKTKKNFIKYKELEIKTSGIEIVMFDFDRSNFSGSFGMFLISIMTFINFYDSYLLEANLFLINKSVSPLMTLKKELFKVTNIESLKNIIGD